MMVLVVMVVLFPASSETNSQPFTLKVVGGAASSVAQDLQKHLQRHRIAAVMRVIGNMRSLVHKRFGELMLASFWMLVNIHVSACYGDRRNENSLLFLTRRGSKYLIH